MIRTTLSTSCPAIASVRVTPMEYLSVRRRCMFVIVILRPMRWLAPVPSEMSTIVPVSASGPAPPCGANVPLLCMGKFMFVMS